MSTTQHSALSTQHSTGILGGTFDPPHNGHLLLAECAMNQFSLARVLFVPAGDPYRKASVQVSSPRHRLAMVRLAVRGNDGLEVDELELRREGPSYTVDTLAALRRRGTPRLVLIIGADALADMRHWKEPRRIESLARIVVAAKGHSAAKIAALANEAGLRRLPEVVDMPPVAISGTGIRARVAAGKPVRYLLPDRVLAYIERRGLYR